MKKLFLLIAYLLPVNLLIAQDTIKFGDSVYMYTNTIVPNYFCNGVFMRTRSNITLGYPIAKRYYADSGTMVYGVAIAISNIYSNSSVNYYYLYEDYMYNDTIDEFINRNRNSDCFSALLFQQIEDSIFLVDSAKWGYPPMERTVEYEVVNQRADCPSNTYGDTLRHYVHMFEFYFKTPQRVKGTFYVGEYDKAERYIYGDFSCAKTIIDGLEHIIEFYDVLVPEEYGKSDWIYFPDWDNDQGNYVIGLTNEAQSTLSFVPGLADMGIFSYIHPILKPRFDGCYAPGKPWMTARTDTTATFEWEELEDSAMLAIGDYLGDPDTMTAIALPAGSTGFTVSGLVAGTYYGAWLKRRCHWEYPDIDTAVWSNWSERVIFSTDINGLSDAAGPEFRLYPNPARDAFTIETEALPARLVLYNPHGIEIYAVELRTQRTTIGIADLPAGVYFAVLTTPSGTATRRVVSE